MIGELQRQIRRHERNSATADMSVRSTGCAGLDALFPEQGVVQGSLVEWVSGGVASGAGTLSLIAGWQVRLADRPFILVDSRQQVSPLALAAVGFDLSQLVTVRPRSPQEALWACEEALRCDGAGLVWADIDHLTGTAFRRLQLAAEASNGIGFLMRPEKALRHSSWADVRLLVRPRSGRSHFIQQSVQRRSSPSFRVDVVSGQGRATRSFACVTIDRIRGVIHEATDANETDFMSLVS
jgi:protein ImuA